MTVDGTVIAYIGGIVSAGITLAIAIIRKKKIDKKLEAAKKVIDDGVALVKDDNDFSTADFIALIQSIFSNF